MRAILSLSGGLDSTALLLNLLKQGYDIHTISYYYGQKNKVELDGLARILHYLEYQQYTIENQRVDLSSVFKSFNSSLTSSDIDVPTGTTDENKMKMNFVPNRNAIFSSLIYGYAVSIAKDRDVLVDIALGVHDGTHTIPPDSTRIFFEKLETAFKEGNVESDRINYYLPYVDNYKEFIVNDAIECCDNLKLDYKTVFRNTLSCYNPTEDGKSCGKCGACNDRISAFKKVKKEDSIIYE